MPDTSRTSSDTLTSAHTNRHAWALEKYGHLLAEALRKDTSAEAREVEKLPEAQIPGLLVSLILERADPTQNKGMTAWLVGQYAQGGLRLEDLGTANETLTMFRRYAPKLDLEKRDLGQHPNLAAVWEAVIGFAQAKEQHLSGKAQKALDRDKAYAESRILRQDEDGFTIAVPLTEFAAKWWGRGTRWCTAAEKDNQFWRYHKDAPLIVMVVPELGKQGKFQIWPSKKGFQFMTAADRPVSKGDLATNWERFEGVVHAAFIPNGMGLEWVPNYLRSEELCRIAVTRNGRELMWVPDHLRTRELCKVAVAEYGRALRWVPEHLRTTRLCRIAVAQDGLALEEVPQKLRTEEICRIAVAQNGYALRYVPEKLRSEELYRIALAQYGMALKFVPEQLRTLELCRIAVAQRGESLRWVPEDLWTDEIYRSAVAQEGGVLREVPEHLRTPELSRIAVAQNGEALRWVPDELRTPVLCRTAVAQAAEALRFVPNHLRWEIEPFVRPEEEPPEAPAWDISLLDSLEKALQPPTEALEPTVMLCHA